MNYSNKITFLTTQVITEAQAKKFGKVNYLTLAPEIIRVIEEEFMGIPTRSHIVGVRTHAGSDYTNIIEVASKCDQGNQYMHQFHHIVLKTKEGLARFVAEKKRLKALEVKKEEAKIPAEGTIVCFSSVTPCIKSNYRKNCLGYVKYPFGDSGKGTFKVQITHHNSALQGESPTWYNTANGGIVVVSEYDLVHGEIK